MGKLIIFAKYIFLIYGSDIYENRRHIHVTYSHSGYKKSCKFWLEPDLEIDENKKGDFNEKELNEIRKLILANKNEILSQLDLFYHGKPVKAIKK